MESTGGFAKPEGDQPERFQVLALAFFVQDVEPEGGFARAGHAGQDDELVLGDRQSDVFQVMQPRAANGDLIGHLSSWPVLLEYIIKCLRRAI